MLLRPGRHCTRCLSLLPLVVTAALAVSVYAEYVMYVARAYGAVAGGGGGGAALLLLEASVYHVLYALTIWALVRTVVTDPGCVSAGYIAAHGGDAPPGGGGEEAARSSERYCGKCRAVRPPRAHHCGVCGVCVLKMDHHCPWISNCVGLYNHKHFVLFLNYAWLACSVDILTKVSATHHRLACREARTGVGHPARR
jgi:hypothetical protein